MIFPPDLPGALQVPQRWPVYVPSSSKSSAIWPFYYSGLISYYTEPCYPVLYTPVMLAFLLFLEHNQYYPAFSLTVLSTWNILSTDTNMVNGPSLSSNSVTKDNLLCDAKNSI